MIAGDETMQVCELCGRALTISAGEPVVCSDCAAEIERDVVRYYSRRGRVTKRLRAFQADAQAHGWVVQILESPAGFTVDVRQAD